jgi:two-component system OmpR family sensor kinase
VSIRTRLALAVGLVLTVLIVVLGFATVRATNTILTDRVEKQIAESKSELERPGRAEEIFSGRVPPYSGKYNANPVAIGSVQADGSIDWVEKSGFGADPDYPPDVPNFGTAGFDNVLDGPVELTSPDGDLPYLVQAYQAKDKQTGEFFGYIVIAAPLNDVKDTVSTLIRWLIVGGVAALAITTAIVWFIIRQGLQPVENMIDTASAIAEGDLSRRVPESALDPYTELGRLGGALNEMLSQIEHSSNLRDESEARLRQFVADAAHELRTPLTSLRGYAELYRQGALRDPEAVSNAMSRIESEGTRMARLVDELLLLARLDQQRGLELTRVDIAELSKDAVADLRAVEPNRPIADVLVPSAIVLGDRLRLRQIIDNLLTNARVHTPPGTPVRLSTRIVDNLVRIEVHDDGPGIPKEDQPHVFERFWRGDRSRGRRSGSSGLGLSIVSSLVESHGGQIRVTSEPGQGTTFTVDLPLADPDPVPADEAVPGWQRDTVGSATSAA